MTIGGGMVMHEWQQWRQRVSGAEFSRR